MLVMDLFGGSVARDSDPWTAVDTLPEGKSEKVLVKRENGEQVIAYYCQDKFMPVHHLVSTDKQYTHFWKNSPPEPLYDVKYWKPLHLEGEYSFS